MGNVVTKESCPNGYSSSVTSGGGNSSLGPSSVSASAGGAGAGASARRRAERERERERRRQQRHEGYQLIVDPSETVDGGYLFPQGVYSGPQDFKVSVVRDCIIRRKLAPFYKGLDEVDPEWTDEQLLDAVYGRTSSTVAETAATPTSSSDSKNSAEASPEPEMTRGMGSLSIDIPKRGSNGTSRSSHLADSQLAATTDAARSAPRGAGAGSNASNTAASGVRTRSHTMSSVQPATQSQKHERDMQQIWLYRNVHECPICFLVYPRLNTTRCCGQEICTECFAQIKRQAPHPPYDAPQNNEVSGSIELVSDPVACPYCAQPSMGVVFEAPPFEWGIPKPLDSDSYSRGYSKPGAHGAGAVMVGGSQNRPRRTSIPATHPDVVTVDMIRPDWEHKLASARRRLARKSAAARALHQTALLPAGAQDSRGSGVSGPPSSTSGDRRPSVADMMRSPHGLTAGQMRELERRMLDEAIRASLETQ